MVNLDGVARADKSAVAHALNLVEDRRPEAHAAIAALLAALTPRPGGHRIGLTGPPGAGKSTLAGALARALRRRGQSVGVVAVDPSSVRSGGALLGDRARMAFNADDALLFVRSLATAGESGGLVRSAALAIEVLAAAYDRVLVETTGVGQSETDVEGVVDTVCLVVQPGAGDALQFLKAGVMEIPDLLVVSKGDLGVLAERAAADLATALGALRASAGGAGAPVLVTSAQDGKGIDALADAIERHRSELGQQAIAARRAEGAARWAVGAFRRARGERGIEGLGGTDSALGLARRALAAGSGLLGAVRAVESALAPERPKG